jgi:hypothetical protein
VRESSRLRDRETERLRERGTWRISVCVSNVVSLLRATPPHTHTHTRTHGLTCTAHTHARTQTHTHTHTHRASGAVGDTPWAAGYAAVLYRKHKNRAHCDAVGSCERQQVLTKSTRVLEYYPCKILCLTHVRSVYRTTHIKI